LWLDDIHWRCIFSPRLREKEVLGMSSWMRVVWLSPFLYFFLGIVSAQSPELSASLSKFRLSQYRLDPS